jgi:hypothetical protein
MIYGIIHDLIEIGPNELSSLVQNGLMVVDLKIDKDYLCIFYACTS